MTTGPTYTSIASSKLVATSTSITISSIPQTYTDLILITNLKLASGTGSAWWRVNGNSASIYSTINFYGDGTTAQKYRGTSLNVSYFNVGNVTNSASTFDYAVLHFNDYSNLTTYKTVLGAVQSDTQAHISVGMTASQSPITSITISNDGSQNFAIGSSIHLYGVTGA